MPKEDKFIENLKRALKNNTTPDRYVKKLRAQAKIDTLFEIRGEQITTLMYYVRENQLDKVRELLSGPNSADPTIANNEQVNALAIAVQKACSDQSYDRRIITELLKINPIQQLTQKNYDNTIPLHEALKIGDFKLVQTFLQHAPTEQLSIKTIKEQDTVFAFAMRSGNNELVSWLIDQYPHILKQRAKDGFTPLHIACKFSNRPIVELLLKNGDREQVLAADDLNILPLQDACHQKNSSIIETLLQYYPLEQLNHVDAFGHTIFHTLSGGGLVDELILLITYAQTHQLDLGKVLCKKSKLGLTTMGMLVKSPLLSSSQKINIVDCLIELGGLSQLELQDDISRATCLLSAVEAEDIALVNKLVTYDCPQQFSLTDKTKHTPLLSAIEKNSLSMVQALLRSGPAKQVYQCGMRSVSPLSYAVLLKKDQTIIRLLLEHLASNPPVGSEEESLSPLHLALAFKDLELFSILIESSYCQERINLKEDDKGCTALHVAVEHNLTKAAIQLIKLGSELDTPNNLGWTPLHVSCWNGNIELFNLLIKKGANPHLKNNAGLNALDIAAASGNLAMVQKLLELGVAINIENEYKSKASIVSAVFYCHADVVELLLAQGVDPNQVIEIEDRNISLLFLALQQMDLELVKLLYKHGADPHQALLKSQTNFTILEFIKFSYRSQSVIYEKLREIFAELPPLTIDSSSMAKKQIDTTITEELPLDTVKENLNPRKYLLSIGYSQQEIEAFEEERKNNKRRLKQNRYAEWQLSEKKPADVITWFNGQIKSDDDFIRRVENPGTNNIYCYLDFENLINQGCDESKIKNKRLKFDGYHIKKLDKDKGVYNELVQLFPNETPQKMEYTHELKINKIDRILLIQHGSLYIGVRYIPGGFHTGASMSSFKVSTKADAECLAIQWPITVNDKEKRLV